MVVRLTSSRRNRTGEREREEREGAGIEHEGGKGALEGGRLRYNFSARRRVFISDAIHGCYRFAGCVLEIVSARHVRRLVV